MGTTPPPTAADLKPGDCAFIAPRALGPAKILTVRPYENMVRITFQRTETSACGYAYISPSMEIEMVPEASTSAVT